MLAGWMLAAGCALSDGGGGTAREVRETEPFDRIRVDDSVDLQVGVGPQSVTAVAEDAVLPILVTRVVDGELQISTEGSFMAWEPRVVEVRSPSIGGVELLGSGDAEIEELSGSRCFLSTAGSGDLTVARIDCQALSLRGTGSGDVEIAEGLVAALDVVMNGAGDAELSGVAAELVRASSTGSGDIAVRAERGIDASSAGSGDIHWTGTTEARVAARGSGDVGRR